MIPRLLTLYNFLSYREATLNFQGLHVACICGPNGAGKSSLLEAMAWAIWGQSRVAADDDVIHLGEAEARVDFVFEHRHQTYRVLRMQRRKQGSFLEFQMQTESGYRSLTQRGVRATQQLILEHLKVDYETFVHSAYLRQGRADEFMLKRPGERKQILADLLKLSRYDRLAEAAREKARDYRAQATLLQANLEQWAVELQQQGAIASTYQQLQTCLEAHQCRQQERLERLVELRSQQQRRQDWQQTYAAKQQQLAYLEPLVKQVEQALEQSVTELQAVEAVLVEAPAIEAGYRSWQQLQIEEETLTRKFQTYEQLKEQQVGLQTQVNQALAHLQAEYQQGMLRLEHLTVQCQDLQETLSQQSTVAAGFAQWQAAKARLQQLDQQQQQLRPLQQRFQELQMRAHQEEARLTARLEAVVQSQAQLTQLQTRRPQLLQAVAEVHHRLDYLEQRRAYQQQVQQKGQERRTFMERLQADQRNYEVQLVQLDQKIQLLLDPEAQCPLCEQPLAEHGERILARHRAERQGVQDQIWVIREQLAVSEREIQVLRREYREIEAELHQYAAVLQDRGHLQAQVTSVDDSANRLQVLTEERQQLEQCLQKSEYAGDWQQELVTLKQALAAANYDERDHALVRNQVEKWRWAEAKLAELKQAARRLAQLQQQRPILQAQMQALEARVQEFNVTHPLAQALQKLTQQLQDLDYSAAHHQQVRTTLRQRQVWQSRWQQWQQAQQQQPLLLTRISELRAQQVVQNQELVAIATHLQTLVAHLEAHPDCQPAIEQLMTEGQRDQAERDRQLAELGRLEQQLKQLAQLQDQHRQQLQTLQALNRQQQVYQALAQAFGKNGLPALMIENLLPQLEAETNQILGRLSGHQLHVQFVTQRAGRQRQKLIDTLDILIADAQGTRAYETYSGGEAFRVNFAIRLALARLLAQRSGMALQMLIVDEGFGTQDQAGCDRLIASINAIAPDFACILTVTHMPHFREAFQTRIDVRKTIAGSSLEISS